MKQTQEKSKGKNIFLLLFSSQSLHFPARHGILQSAIKITEKNIMCFYAGLFYFW